MDGERAATLESHTGPKWALGDQTEYALVPSNGGFGIAPYCSII